MREKVVLLDDTIILVKPRPSYDAQNARYRQKQWSGKLVAKSGKKWYFSIEKSLEKLVSRYLDLEELNNVENAFERDCFGFSKFEIGFDCTSWPGTHLNHNTANR